MHLRRANVEAIDSRDLRRRRGRRRHVYGLVGSRNVDPTACVGIDSDSGDGQAIEGVGFVRAGHEGPGMAAVLRHVNARAVEGVAGVIGLTGAQVDRVRVVGIDSDGASEQSRRGAGDCCSRRTCDDRVRRACGAGSG